MDYRTAISAFGIVLLFCSIAFVAGAVKNSEKVESDFFDNPEVTINLWHYFGGDEPSDETYSSRGFVTIRNFRGPRFTSNQRDFSETDLKQIKKLAESGGYYFVKSTVKTSSGEKSFRSFASAQSLLQSGLSDILRVHMNPTGEIVAIGYHLLRSDFSSTPDPQKFNSTVVIHQGELGPQPDVNPFLEKLELERLAKERGEDPRDNRSFLAKYWMYIVPIAIMVLLSGASTPEGG